MDASSQSSDHYLKYFPILFLVCIKKMALSSISGNATYVDCKPTDELFGEKLSSIVGYAMSVMGIDSANVNSSFPEENFSKYCSGLQSKIKTYEPYNRSVQISDFKTSIRHTKELADKIRSLLPRKTPEFNQIIEQTAENVSNVAETDSIVFSASENHLTLAEFVVLKVFRAGDNLELIPCLLRVYSKREQCSMFFKTLNWKECIVNMDYEERTYVLHKFMIQQIISKLPQTDYVF